MGLLLLFISVRVHSSGSSASASLLKHLKPPTFHLHFSDQIFSLKLIAYLVSSTGYSSESWDVIFSRGHDYYNYQLSITPLGIHQHLKTRCTCWPHPYPQHQISSWYHHSELPAGPRDPSHLVFLPWQPRRPWHDSSIELSLSTII